MTQKWGRLITKMQFTVFLQYKNGSELSYPDAKLMRNNNYVMVSYLQWLIVMTNSKETFKLFIVDHRYAINNLNLYKNAPWSIIQKTFSCNTKDLGLLHKLPMLKIILKGHPVKKFLYIQVISVPKNGTFYPTSRWEKFQNCIQPSK